MDRWNSGSAYVRYVGRWSRMVAREYITWLGVADQKRWLDVGCGTGTLSEVILQTAAPDLVKGIDLSEAFIEYARAHVSDQRASFEIGSADAIPVGEAEFDAVVSGLVLNFVPDHAKMVREMRRAAVDGGIIGVYVWDYADQMQMMRVFWDVAAEISAQGRELDEGSRFPICKPEPLAALFTNSGLREVEVRAIDIPTRFRDFDDYWQPFLGGTGSAPTYVTSLSETDRSTLQDRLRAALPIQADGSIEMIARAWAVKAKR